MKKLTTLLFLIITFTCLLGCGNDKDAAINRLSKSLETATKTTEYYLQEIDELKTENYELLVTIDGLKSKIANQKSTISEFESKNSQSNITYVVNTGSSDSYLAMKFWSDGNNYVGSSTVTWYSDYYCSKPITSNVTIISPTIDRLTLSNGHLIYICMSSNGLVFSSENPYLIVKQ